MQKFLELCAGEAAGGIVLHDLFADDEGGSPQDASLLDRPAMENSRRQSPDRHRDPDVDRLRQLALCFFTANVRNPSTRRAYMRGRAAGSSPGATIAA